MACLSCDHYRSDHRPKVTDERCSIYSKHLLFRYEFPVRRWLDLNGDGEVFECRERKEDAVLQQRHRQSIKYKIIVHTGDVSGAGTDANVSIILYGTLGDTGKRDLKQKGRNLFERNQVDEFVIESLDLGKNAARFVSVRRRSFV